MNPLNSNPFNSQALLNANNQIMQNLKQVKSLMSMANGNPQALLQQYPQLKQVMQMTRGKDLQSTFYSMCQQRGIDPNVILNELRS